MSFEGGDDGTGVLLQLQQGDLSRVVTNERVLSVKVIPGGGSQGSLTQPSPSYKAESVRLKERTHKPKTTKTEMPN